MDEDKQQKAEETVAGLQERWGARSVGRLGKVGSTAFPHLSTGFPELDEALSIGGLPRGRISEFSSVPTSGMATVALKIIAQDQLQNHVSAASRDGAANMDGAAIYIDPAHTFDPEYAAHCGLDLSQLILVRPYDIPQALAIMSDFILIGKVSCLVFDVPPSLLKDNSMAQALSASLGRIIAPLSQSDCTLLFLTTWPAGSDPALVEKNPSPAGSALSHYATVRLHIKRERWIYRQRDIRGYQAQILVLKNKLGPAGRLATIEIAFSDEFEDKP